MCPNSQKFAFYFTTQCLFIWAAISWIIGAWQKHPCSFYENFVQFILFGSILNTHCLLFLLYLVYYIVIIALLSLLASWFLYSIQYRKVVVSFDISVLSYSLSRIINLSSYEMLYQFSGALPSKKSPPPQKSLSIFEIGAREFF